MKAVYNIFVIAGISLLAFSCKSGKSLTKRKKYMERTYISVKDVLNDAEVTLLTDTVKVVFKDNVLFDFNKAEIHSNMYPAFERFSKVLNRFDKTNILIVGHTDSVGGDNANNRQLSLRRADSARNLLVSYKVAIDRINTWGFGAKEPIASNATEEGRARNRRVEFIMLYDYDRKKHQGSGNH